MSEDRSDCHDFLPSHCQRPVFLSCEHASNRIPEELDCLGLPQAEINRHIGWDPGAAAVARHLHILTGQPLILGRYSRLVVDLNRPEESAECVIETSDTTCIPGNQNLTEEERAVRIRTYHRPFHGAFSRLIDEICPKALLAVHSFTPALRKDGIRRPWHCGILHGQAMDLAERCISHLNASGEFLVGRNEPYEIDTASDYTVPLHGDARGLPAVLVEIRQDLIATADEQKRWARILAEMVARCFP